MSMDLHNFPPLPSDCTEGNQKIKMGSPPDNQGLDEALESNTSNISLLVRWNLFSLETLWTQSCLRFFIYNILALIAFTFRACLSILFYGLQKHPQKLSFNTI